MRTELFAHGLLALALSSCVASGMLPQSHRSVAAERADDAWLAASSTDLEGLYESIDVSGEAAGGLLKIYYCFNADHTYTGAALTTGIEHAEFTTLSGAWELVDGDLRLDSTERLSASVSDGRLRLENERGTAVFEKVAIR